jgi:hypothetical protein
MNNLIEAMNIKSPQLAVPGLVPVLYTLTLYPKIIDGSHNRK